MRFFDTHAHYTDNRFNAEYDGGADMLLERVFASGVDYIINAGTDIESSAAACKQAEKYKGMYAAAGIHPEDCMKPDNPDYELLRLRGLLDRKSELKIVALGEIGLDYYWDASDKNRQLWFFERQLEMSVEYGLPVVIHDRDAHGDCFEAVLRHPDARGIFHSFSGSPEMAVELTRRGWYISFSGVVSFKNARKSREAAAIIPQNRILIETDCPYLAPEPFRGKLNRSDYLLYTLNAVAAARSVEPESLSEAIFENSREIFSV